MTLQPTPDQSRSYQLAFDHFNSRLFGGELPPAMLNFSRHAGSKGFFKNSTWVERVAFATAAAKEEQVVAADMLHEISLNPDLLLRSPEEYYGTLVHEMCHHWQQCFGKVSRNGYHNQQWASKMVSIGLTPTHTGEPGGKKTGQNMTHMIDAGGPFLAAFRSLPAEALLPWVAGEEPADKKKTTKPKKVCYQCGGCGTQVWAVDEDLHANCGDCDEPFQVKGTKEKENDDG